MERVKAPELKVAVLTDPCPPDPDHWTITPLKGWFVEASTTVPLTVAVVTVGGGVGLVSER